MTFETLRAAREEHAAKSKEEEGAETFLSLFKLSMKFMFNAAQK